MVTSRIAGRLLRLKPPSSIPGVSFPWLRPRRRLSFAPDRVPARPSRAGLAKVAHLRAREGLTFTSSSTMASLERRIEFRVCGRICQRYRRMQSRDNPLHHRPSVKDRNPHGRRRAFRAAPGRPFGAVGPDPAPSRGGDAQMVRSKRHYRHKQRHHRTRHKCEITGSGEMRMRFDGSYLVRGAVNIGALAERAGMVL
jgi:hypothetical protein